MACNTDRDWDLQTKLNISKILYLKSILDTT